MSLAPLLAEVQAIAEAIGEVCGVPMSARLAADQQSRQLLWIDALPPGLGRFSLVYLRSGKDVRALYVVGRSLGTHRPRRCASKPHALRVLADEAMTAWRLLDTGDNTPAATDAVPPDEAEQDHAAEGPAPTTASGPKQTYTADEAVAHPVIRAAVIAGHEVARSTGTRPDPAVVRAMANAALAVVDVLWPYYARKDDGPEFIEHILIGTLTGALSAAKNRPA